MTNNSLRRLRRSGARMTATIEGLCTVCDEWYDPGDYIRYEVNIPVHMECYGVRNA